MTGLMTWHWKLLLLLLGLIQLPPTVNSGPFWWLVCHSGLCVFTGVSSICCIQENSCCRTAGRQVQVQPVVGQQNQQRQRPRIRLRPSRIIRPLRLRPSGLRTSSTRLSLRQQKNRNNQFLKRKPFNRPLSAELNRMKQ